MKNNEEGKMMYSMIMHELKTSLLCMSSVLRDMLNSGDIQSKKIAMCEKEMSNLAEYLTQISSAAQVMTRADLCKTEAVNLQEFADFLRHRYQSVANERRVKLFVQVEQEAYRYLYFDKSRMIHILNNLVLNAVKYSKENGRIIISLSSQELEEYRASLKIVVQDDGIGMSDTFRKRAFEAYTRENRNMSDGNGIGLVIVKKIAEQMNGTIRIDAKPGAGTAVILDFEIDGADECFERVDADKGNERAGGCLAQYDFTGRKILVAEDEELFMNWIVEALEKYGMAVDKTYDGREVTDLFEASAEQEYDAILMDLVMPDMGGLEAACHIRACDRADAQTIPILAFTGMPIENEEAFLAEYKMQAVVPKSFDEASFVRLFAALFDVAE